MKEEAFSGFSPETIDFLWGIRMNNNRQWFLEHKTEYTKFLYEPLKALGRELYKPFQDQTGTLLKVSRIYRDSRLHPPEPYKESLWLCIRADVQWWGENPCLFLEVNPQGIDYGFLLWQPKTAAMNRFRQIITENPEPWLAMVKKAERQTGLPLSAHLYKRPKPTDNPELMPYFAWKDGITCIRHLDAGEAAFSPNLAGEVSAFFEKLVPLYDYWNRICSIGHQEE